MMEALVVTLAGLVLVGGIWGIADLSGRRAYRRWIERIRQEVKEKGAG